MSIIVYLSIATVESYTGEKYDYDKMIEVSNGKGFVSYEGGKKEGRLFHAAVWDMVYGIDINKL